MKEVYVNRKIHYGPFGGGNLFLQAIETYSEEFGVRFHQPSESFTSTKDQIEKEKIDAIFMMDPRLDNGSISWIGAKKLKDEYDIPIIHRVNEIDKKRSVQIGIDFHLRELSKISDLSIFVSDWMKKEHTDMGWSEHPKLKVLYNGVVETAREIDSQKKSERDSRTRIVVHHWSPDAGKGDELHLFLDSFADKYDGYIFVYIGRTNINFKGKNTEHIQPICGEALFQKLKECDVYINGSQNDPAPNSILEALACGLPTYVPFFGGGSLDLIYHDESHIWNSYDDLEKILLSKKYDQNKFKRLRTWKECVEEFCEMINEV